MIRPYATAAAAVFGVLVGLGAALAQNDQPTVKFNFFEIEDGHLVVGKSFKIDAEFGAAHDKMVKAPFRFIAPTSDDVLVQQQPTPGSDSLVKIAYGTLDRQFIENFQFSTLTVPLGAEDERLNTVAGLLANQGFAMVVEPYKESTRDGVRKIMVGDYSAVEVFGRYVDPANGLMYARLVGILNPNSTHGVFMVANIAAARLPLDNPDQLATKTRSGAALKTFKYID